MLADRRRSHRCHVAFYVDQYIDDHAHRCFSSNLSEGGIYMERVLSPLHRTRPIVQLDINLPGHEESIWACGEVVQDRVRGLFHGTAVRFVSMASRHERYLQDYLRTQVRQEDRPKTVALPSGQLVHIRRPNGRRPTVRKSRLHAFPNSSAERMVSIA